MKKKIKIRSHVFWPIVSWFVIFFMYMGFSQEAEKTTKAEFWQPIMISAALATMIAALVFVLLRPDKPEKIKEKKDKS